MTGYEDIFRAAIAQFEIFKIPQGAHNAANLYQAIHFAYRYTGNPIKAADCIKHAAECALKAAQERNGQLIFSAVQYKYIPSSKFIAECRHLIQGLLRKYGRYQSSSVAPEPVQRTDRVS
jgi:hypothetical protein